MLIVLVASGALTYAAPKPALVQGPDLWTAEVKFEHPEQIIMNVAGEDTPKRFWYLILTITNNSREDVQFVPKCELVTDTFQVIPAGQKVPVVVFDKIKTRYQGRYPFLEWVEKTSFKLLQGEDHTKDIAVIWRDFDPDAKNIKLFISGLSNETVVLKHPTLKNDEGLPETIFLRKTMLLEYNIGGDEKFRSSAKLELIEKGWVMR